MGAIEISGIGATIMGQGVFFDAGATMAAVLLSLLGIAAAGILASGLTLGGRRVLRAGRRAMPLSAVLAR